MTQESTDPEFPALAELQRLRDSGALLSKLRATPHERLVQHCMLLIGLVLSVADQMTAIERLVKGAVADNVL